MKALGIILGICICLLPLAMYGFLRTMPTTGSAQRAPDAQLHRLFTTPEGCNVYSFRDADTLHYMAACPGASVQGSSGGTITTLPPLPRRARM